MHMSWFCDYCRELRTDERCLEYDTPNGFERVCKVCDKFLKMKRKALIKNTTKMYRKIHGDKIQDGIKEQVRKEMEERQKKWEEMRNKPKSER